LHHFDTMQQCDGQRNGQTDAQATAKMREAFCYRERKADCLSSLPHRDLPMQISL